MRTNPERVEFPYQPHLTKYIPHPCALFSIVTDVFVLFGCFYSFFGEGEAGDPVVTRWPTNRRT